MTATTTDATQVRGGLSVQVEWTDVVPGANPPIVARSAQLSAAGSTWSGTAHLAALPLGPRALTVRCQRAESGAAAAQGTATVTVTQSDAGAPHIVVNSPPAGETIALPASGSTSVTLQGTTMDTQSGMAGGQATTEWATVPGGPWAAVVPTAAGNFSSWTATIPITAAGTVVVYVRATDNAGNTTAAPLQWTANVVPAYTPSSVADRISEREYLQALLEFAVGQVTAGAAGAATSAQLTSLLGQPFTDISVPGAAADAASAAVNVLRVPIELLRSYLAAATVTVPESAELPARFTAYQSLLAALGTSFAELRLARAGTTAERAALAARLGITLSASRPDELDQLCLDPQTLTEAQLGVMFGWPSTSSATPLVPTAPGLLQAWQLATQLQAWLSSDAGTTPFVVADPDVITAADVLAHTAQTTRITGLLTSRAGDLQGQHDVLAGTLTTQTGAHAADTAIFAALLDQGVPGFDLAGTITADAAGDDVSATLAAAGLTRSGFSYLGQLDTLAGTGLVTGDEWTALIDVLVGAYRRRSYATWAAQETGLVVGPDYFVDSGVGTGLSTYRIEATARPDWVALVQARAAQRAALLQTNASALAAADAAALPVLRDALLAAAQQHIDPTGKVDAGDTLTNRYQLDFTQSGALTTTRMSQAVASLQAVLLLVRSGDIAQVPDASTWTLTNSPAQFDDAWAWLGSIDSWQAAMVTYLFPEAALDPAQFGATPGAATASAAFTALTSAVETLADLTPGDAATHVNSYATSNASWVPAAGASGVVYLSGRDAPHQATLAGWSASVAAASGADAALEMFWAVPMLVAQRLQAAGHYQDALDWYWVVLPYNELSARAAYHEINTELAAAPQRPSVPFPATWTANLDPIAVARQRLTSAPFARATISQIAACLAAYADAEFTAETAGSLAHARDLYLTASSLLAHPALVPLQPTEPGEGNFEIPQVDALRQRIASQLSKLRGGRNIAGLLRTSAGADGDSAGVPEPTPYHYKVLLTRAQQLTAQSAQVEALYLSLLEKLDAGTLKLQEAANAASIANLQLNVHADQVAAAIAGQAAAQAQVTKAQAMIDTYQANIDAPPNQYEQALLGNYSDMRNAADTLAGVDAAIGIAQATSNFNLVDPATWVGSATAIVAQGAKDGVQAWVNNIQSQEQAELAAVEHREPPPGMAHPAVVVDAGPRDRAGADRRRRRPNRSRTGRSAGGAGAERPGRAYVHHAAEPVHQSQPVPLDERRGRLGLQLLPLPSDRGRPAVAAAAGVRPGRGARLVHRHRLLAAARPAELGQLRHQGHDGRRTAQRRPRPAGRIRVLLRLPPAQPDPVVLAGAADAGRLLRVPRDGRALLRHPDGAVRRRLPGALPAANLAGAAVDGGARAALARNSGHAVQRRRLADRRAGRGRQLLDRDAAPRPVHGGGDLTAERKGRLRPRPAARPDPAVRGTRRGHQLAVEPAAGGQPVRLLDDRRRHRHDRPHGADRLRLPRAGDRRAQRQPRPRRRTSCAASPATSRTPGTPSTTRRRARRGRPRSRSTRRTSR